MESDDWILDSVKTYKQLHMYELQKSVCSQLEWIDSKSICVGLSDSSKHELIELNIPEDLITDQEGGGLNKERDFTVRNGCLCDSPVSEIKHVPDSRCIVTAHVGDNSLVIWQLGSESTDLISQLKYIQTARQNGPREAYFRKPTTGMIGVITSQSFQCADTHLAVADSNTVLFGSVIKELCLADLDRGQVVHSFHDAPSSEIISKIMFLGHHTFLLCTHSGEFYLIDSRTAHSIIALKDRPTDRHSNHKAAFSTFTVNRGDVCGSQKGDNSVVDYVVYKLSSDGEFEQSDLRNMNKCVNKTVIESDLGSTCKGISHKNLCLQACPYSANVISVSGLDSHVSIYNLSHRKLNKDNESHLPASFIHKGHMICSDSSVDTFVTGHVWYPGQCGLILSTGNDCSLHGWEIELGS